VEISPLGSHTFSPASSRTTFDRLYIRDRWYSTGADADHRSVLPRYEKMKKTIISIPLLSSPTSCTARNSCSDVIRSVRNNDISSGRSICRGVNEYTRSCYDTSLRLLRRMTIKAEENRRVYHVRGEVDFVLPLLQARSAILTKSS